MKKNILYINITNVHKEEVETLLNELKENDFDYKQINAKSKNKLDNRILSIIVIEDISDYINNLIPYLKLNYWNYKINEEF